jgi:DNA-binding transcriptional regulator YdaS (Cro superfamily)
LLLEISAAEGVIMGKTIKQWDTGRKVTPAERAVVIDKVSEVLRQLGATQVEIV